MSPTSPCTRISKHPLIIQGGMGVGVSGWPLARAVSRTGHLGVVAGTALAVVLCHRLQDGDLDGSMRRAMAAFPDSQVVSDVLQRYYCKGGKSVDVPYKRLPMYTTKPSRHLVEMTVLANFVEVYLAKEGHGGVVGVNYLEKLQLPNLPSLYGAMLAGVDYVLVGAGIPLEIPGVLDRLAFHMPVDMRLHVTGGKPDSDHRLAFDPKQYMGDHKRGQLKRPKFLAIISSASLAGIILRKSTGRVDGFVVEGHFAGGHNAPPRGKDRLNDGGEPVYGEKDSIDLEQMRSLDVPFWLAGGFGHPEKLQYALEQGAQGIQVGTAFAFSKESGYTDALKHEVLKRASEGRLDVLTDPRASPTGFPFKVAQLPNTLSDPNLFRKRRRVCDLGYLRQVYACADGTIGYRCPGEPIEHYLAKGGKREDTHARKCLCNALAANVGAPQTQAEGLHELPLVTIGESTEQLKDLLSVLGSSYQARDVVTYLSRSQPGE